MYKKLTTILLGTALLTTGCGINTPEIPSPETQTPIETRIDNEQKELKHSIPVKTDEQKDPDTPVTPIDIKEVSDQNEALFNLSKAVINTDTSNKNIMVSPLSIERCFALAIEGANGETKDQLVKAVYSNLNFDKTSLNIGDLCKKLSTYEEITYDDDWNETDTTKNAFSVANSIWVNSDIPDMKLKSEYENKVKEKYNAKATGIPFSNGPKPINDWVNTNTDGMIPEILNKLTPDDRAVLVNATMFEGEWRDKFTEIPEQQEFTDVNGNKQLVNFLSSYKDDNYVQIKGRDAFVKYYNNGFKYVGILPNENETAEDLLNDLNFKDVTDGINNSTEYDLILTFPEYSYDYDTSLVNVFKRLGVNNAFSDKADFSNMSDTPLYISDAIHKTHIEVDKEGTKAAAVTAIMMETTCALPEETPVKELNFNRPFVYMILSTEDELPAFVGIVNNIDEQPQKTSETIEFNTDDVEINNEISDEDMDKMIRTQTANPNHNDSLIKDLDLSSY